MAAVERDVVNYYNLPTPYPEEWPAELDESDKSDDDSITINSPESPNLRRSKSRYSALERSTGERRSIPGSQRTGDGRDNLVQKDEQDPLGSADSVVRILRQRGLPVEDDARMRNRFLLSSTTFSPALFLSQTHSDASTSSLLQGLDHLSRSIDQKSASLKVLVESNFERFVRAKATIDTVYTEMRNQGDPAEGSRSLDVKRSSGHLRSYSSGRAPSPGLAASNAVPKKNALTKESEYGVKGIRTPLAEASAKAEEVWGPALSGRDLEQGLKAVMNAMDKQRGVYEVGANIMRFIKQRDYESVVAEYNRARNYANEAKTIGDEATNSNQPLTDEQIHTIIVTGRMWMDVEHQIEDFKRDLWRRLSNVQTTTPAMTVSGLVEEHMELIGVLLELGVDDNPVWVWLLSRYDFLKTKITTFCERSKVEIEILRRQLAHGDKPTPESVTPYLRLSTREGPGKNLNQRLDTEQVVEFWECIHTFLTKLLSVPNGILGDVVDFWEVAQAFINGTKQQFLPTGFQGESRKHHRLSSDGVKDLQDGVVELISLIRESVFSLFSDSPIEDISLLSSPLPQSNPATPLSGLTPTESRFKLDPKNLPPPSPQNGEPWEGFAFWPPYSNSISGVHYLSKFLILIGTGASDMTGMRPVASGSNTYDRLKSLVSGARERCVRAVCSAWNKDAENCKYLEDWRRDSDRRDLTKMPGLFVAFESAVLSGMQKILYISEAMSKSGTVDVVTPPPAKLLQMVRTQFVTSIYKALSGLVENAENPIKSEDDEWVVVDPSVASSGTDIASSGITADYIDAKNRVSPPSVFREAHTDIYITERPHAAHAFQSQSAPNGYGPTTSHQLRNLLFRQTNRRIQNYSRRARTDRLPPLPILHAPDSRNSQLHHHKRHRRRRLGPIQQPPGPSPSIRLHDNADTRPRPHRSLNHDPHTHSVYFLLILFHRFPHNHHPNPPLILDIQLPPNSLHFPPEIHTPRLDAGNPGHRVHRPDDVPVLQRRGIPDPKPDISGTRSADEQRGEDEAAGRAG